VASAPNMNFWCTIQKIFVKILRLALRSMSFLAILLIRIYQLTLSYFIGRKCRFFPSCSEYMKLAIKKHGFFRGIKLGIRRIARCNHFGGDGVDFP